MYGGLLGTNLLSSTRQMHRECECVFHNQARIACRRSKMLVNSRQVFSASDVPPPLGPLKAGPELFERSHLSIFAPCPL
jgi:hypothetical protein